MAPEIPKQMKAQLLEKYNTSYQYRSVDIPKPSSEHDVLIKVDAASYCHTDAVMASGQMDGNPRHFPHIGSHEIAGTVVALSGSPADTTSDFPIGTRVGVPGRGYGTCGSCFECRSTEDYVGFSMNCTRGLSNGLSKDGGFGEYCLVDARQLTPLPDSLSSLDAAPLMCAGVTIYNALKRCNPETNKRVGIIGCGGGLGHLGLQFAEAMDLRVTGVDAADEPLKLAKSLGTKATIVDARSTTADDYVQQVGKEDGRQDRLDMGLDAVIILPESQISFDYGVKLLRNHGTCVVVSFPEAGFHVSARDLVFRDIHVVGSLLGTNSSLREMVAFAGKHGVKTVKKVFSLDKLNELVDEYNKGEGGKLVVDMTG